MLQNWVFMLKKKKKIEKLLGEIKEIESRLGSDDSELSLQEMLESKLDDLEALKEYARFSAGIDDVTLLLQNRKKKGPVSEKDEENDEE